MPVHTMFRTHVYRHVHTVDKVVCHVIVIVTPLIAPHVLVRPYVGQGCKTTIVKNAKALTQIGNTDFFVAKLNVLILRTWLFDSFDCIGQIQKMSQFLSHKNGAYCSTFKSR